ncbi:DNA mismatch repair protein MutS [uncultured Prevotella sp.]|uniref:MutS-related protein n=1 Tax=uncultured Prevotella sp. TaxID=159272 RepID=UPI002638772C|nr:DNA mismatch repair protein MutS [uncultured Prevotella sp.]
MDNRQEFYSRQVESLSAMIQRLKRKGRTYVAMELATFCLAVLAFVFFCLRGLPVGLLCLSVAFMAAYVVARRADVHNSETTDMLRRRRQVYEKELSYLRGDYSCFGSGSRYIDSSHAFTYDMDVFGRDSLFNRINRTVTTGGSNFLASSLQNLLTDIAAIDARRKAIAELADMESWRTEFLALGQRLTSDTKKKGEAIDTAMINRVVSEISAMNIAPQAGSMFALVVAWAAIAGFVAIMVLAILGIVPSSLAVMWGVVQMFVVIALNIRSLRNISRAVEKLHAHLHDYIGLIRHIGGAEFESGCLKDLHDRLTLGSDGALTSFGELSDILKSLDRRGNFIGLILFNMFALSDFFLVRHFLRWQRHYIERIAEWTDSVSQIDAFVSMAVYSYNEQQAVAAEVVEADGVVYEAKGIYHPFLGAKAVSNDFTIDDGNYYIVTGANMAGKSTFLRSIGVNYILAMNGMPVFAESLRVSVFNLFSSMRTADDLSRGISYFNAELLRLRQLIESCKHATHTLIILDEILKGTNSLDKLNGSRLFLQEISRLPVSGIIATHDLELSKLEDDSPSRFHNWCFEIELGGNITYTYKITPGVARNQNATYLLKKIIGEI